MGKRFGTVAAAVMLLFCGWIGWFWYQSYRGVDHIDTAGRGRLELNIGGQMYTLRCDPGHLLILRTPDLVRPTPADVRVCDLSQQMRNDELEWGGWTWTNDDGSAYIVQWDLSIDHNSNSTELIAQRASPPSPTLIPSPLRALDDPARFAIAHVLLVEALDRRPTAYAAFYSENPFFGVTLHHGWGNEEFLSYYGLGLPIARPEANIDYHHNHLNQIVKPQQKELARIDASDRVRLRTYWHDRLDVPVKSISYGWLMSFAAAPALAWLVGRLWRTGVRRYRRLRGLCLMCGYNLTGNPSGTCPECGTRTLLADYAPA